MFFAARLGKRFFSHHLAGTMLGRHGSYLPVNRSLTLLAACCAAVVVSVPAYADDALRDVNNQVTLSAGGQHLNYVESTAQYDPLDSEKGTQASWQVGATVQRDILGIQDVYISASATYSNGSTHYDGYLEDNFGFMTPYQSTTHDKTIDVDVRLGKAFRVLPQAQIVPYIEYGSHSWIRDSSSEAYGYYEHYRHQSVAVGILGQYAITPKLVASVDGGVGRTFAGKMTSGITDGTFELGSSTTTAAQFGVDYAVTRHLHVHATYRISHFKYGASNVIDNEYEPDSTTTEHLVMAGLGYSF